MDNQRQTRLRSQTLVKEVPISKLQKLPTAVEISEDELVDDRELPVLRGENKRKRGLRGAGRRLKQFVELQKEDVSEKLLEYDVSESNGELKVGEKDGYSSAGEALSTAASPLERKFSTDISEEPKAMRQQGDKRRESSRLRVKPSKFRESITTTILKPKEQKGSDDVSSSLEIVLPMDVQNPSVGQSVGNQDSEIDKPSQSGRRHTKGTQRPSRSNETLGSAHESSSSPRRGFEDNGLKASLAVVKRVMQIKSAEPFNEPVDPVALEIPDYLDVIKEPMDLGTIRENLESSTHYTSAQEVYDDVQLVWSNCRKYNQEGDPIMDIMKTAETVFNRHWNAAGLQDYMSTTVHPRKTNQEDNNRVDYDGEDEGEEDEEFEDPKRMESKESKAAAKLKSVKIVHFDTPPSRTKAKRSVSVEQAMAESKAREDKIEIDDVELINEHSTVRGAQAAVEVLAVEEALLKTPDRRSQGSKNSKKKVIKETEQAEMQEQSDPEPKTPTTDRDTSSHGSPPPSSHKRRGSPPSSKRRTFGTAHHKPDCICVVCLGRRRKLAKLAMEQGDRDGDDEPLLDENVAVTPVQEGRSKKHPKVRTSEKSGKRSEISGTAVPGSITPGDSDLVQPDIPMGEASDPEPTAVAFTTKVESAQYYPANHELPLRKVSGSVLHMSHYLFGPTGISLLGRHHSLGYKWPRTPAKSHMLEAVSSLTWSDKKAGQV